MSDLVERFSGRHENLAATFDDHAEKVMGLVDQDISATRRQLLGAAFTHEYSSRAPRFAIPVSSGTQTRLVWRPTVFES